MSKTDQNIQHFVLLDHDSLEFPEGHAYSLQLFMDSVIIPSLQTIDREIDENLRDEDPSSVFFESNLSELYQATVESYLLSVQSMWERGLRRLLVSREKRLNGGKEVEAVQKALWAKGAKSIQCHFQRLMGISIMSFDSYDDLDFLQHLGNAIRHGDGPSANKVYELAPTLWFNSAHPAIEIKEGYYGISIPDKPLEYPSFESVTLQRVVVQQMIRSVSDFWEDLEYVRCNSFRNKSESVIQRLQNWSEIRVYRHRNRIWNCQSVTTQDK